MSTIETLCSDIEDTLKTKILPTIDTNSKEIIYKTIYHDIQNVKELVQLLEQNNIENIKETAKNIKQAQDLLLQTKIIKWLLIDE